MNQSEVSKDRAIPIDKIISLYFNYLNEFREAAKLRRDPPFLPGGKICRFLRAKPPGVIA
jgi:hypothetical protein